MKYVFIVGIVLLALFILWLNTRILQYFLKRNAKLEFSFKKTLALLVLFWSGFIFTTMVVVSEFTDSISIVLVPITSFTLFYLLMRLFIKPPSSVPFASTLKVYLLSGLAGGFVTIVLLTFVRYYVVAPHIIIGEGIHSVKDGDYIMFDTITNSYEQGDLVVFDSSKFYKVSDKISVRRIIGLPNQKIEISGGEIIVNGSVLNEPYATGELSWTGQVTLGDDEYFVLLDNRSLTSESSLKAGIIRSEQIIGEYRFTLFSLGESK